jgi:hypothetical protein
VCIRGERPLDVLIRIWIDRTQPLAGHAATKAATPLHFNGWLELLRVVSELVAAGDADLPATDNPSARDETGN